MKTENKKVASFIKSKRKQIGVTQIEFANLLKINKANLANYECGRAMPPAYVILNILEQEQKEAHAKHSA